VIGQGVLEGQIRGAVDEIRKDLAREGHRRCLRKVEES
jgi:hypothetical protein